MANFILANNPQTNSKGICIAIDGKDIQTWPQFYAFMAKELEFPEYFEGNLDSLDECLNDLEWIDKENITLSFLNFEDFLAKERADHRLSSLFNLLDATAEDWKWVDDDEPSKNLVITVNNCTKAKEILDAEEIVYTSL